MNVEGARDSLYAYGWGLVSGLTSGLLSTKDYEALIISKDIPDMLNQLTNTSYGDYLKAIGPTPRLYDIQKRIDESYGVTYSLVCAHLDVDDRKMMDLLIRGLWDLQNLKAYVRARERGILSDVTGHLNDFGSISSEEFQSLAQDEEVLMKGLPDDYSLLLEKAFTMSSLSEMEHALDVGLMELMIEKTTGDIRDYALKLADIMNIRTVLLCKLNGVDAKGIVFSNGYYLSPMKLDEILRSDMASIPNLLEGTPYQKAVLDVVSKTSDELIETLDARLNRVLSDQMRLASVQDPLSINSSLSYLKAKEDEVKSLKAVVAGIWHNMPKDGIRRLIS